MKRKLCIAMSLMGNSKYLFMDEPSTGLDPVASKKKVKKRKNFENDYKTL